MQCSEWHFNCCVSSAQFSRQFGSLAHPLSVFMCQPEMSTYHFSFVTRFFFSHLLKRLFILIHFVCSLIRRLCCQLNEWNAFRFYFFWFASKQFHIERESKLSWQLTFVDLFDRNDIATPLTPYQCIESKIMNSKNMRRCEIEWWNVTIIDKTYV